MNNESDFRRIQQIAYGLWEKDGRPEGRDAEHWAQAERSLGLDGAAAPEEDSPGSPETLGSPRGKPNGMERAYSAPSSAAQRSPGNRQD
jgi:hypothetical protein